MKNIVLIGFMGAGKSSILKELMEEDSFSYLQGYDLDEEIEKKLKKNISEIIKENGLSYFRKIETEVFQELAMKKNAIIACGGGVVEATENDKWLEESICIFLDAPVELLFQRVVNAKIDRPLAKIGTEEKYYFEEFKRLYDNRLSMYRKNANLTFDTDKNKPKEIINEILKLVERKN